MRVLGRTLAALVAVVLLVLAGLYAASPWLIEKSLKTIAQANGFTTADIALSRPRLSGIEIQSLRLVSPDLRLEVEDVRVSYAWSGLLQGRVESVLADRVRLIVEDPPTATQNQTQFSPGLLFPALPVDAIAIQTLRLEVKALDFVGQGTANWDEESLLLTMDGIAPEVASRFAFVAALSADGRFDMAARQAGVEDGEIVNASGGLSGDRLAVAGQIDLQGYALDLAAALADVPPGDGRIAGQFDLQVPWPLPQALDWQDLRVDLRDGRVVWTQQDGSLALDLSMGQMIVRDGTVRADAAGAMSLDWDGGRGALKVPSGYQLIYTDDVLSGGEGPRLSARTSDIETSLKLQQFRVGPAVPLQASVEVLSLNLPEQPPSGHLKGAQAELTYDLDSGAGALGVKHQLQITKALLASLIPDWTEDYDIDRGRIDLAVEASWHTPDVVPVSVTYELQNLAGHYEDYRIREIVGAGKLTTAAFGEAAWQLVPAEMAIGGIDIGFPVTEVRFTVGGTLPVLQITGSSATLLGGRARTEPFAYDLEAGNADIELRMDGVDLTAVLALEGEDVAGSGTLNGYFPIRVRQHVFSMQGGVAQSIAPGGTIRLAPALAQPTGQPGLDFALTALQDFRFTDLAASVDYAENGDLRLGVKLKGNNPAVERGRAIEYNLNISENLPVLLESLRMQDQVRKSVERKLNQ